MIIINKLAQTPAFCVLITVLLFLVGMNTICGLLGSLLQMHRSKSAVKKLMKEYTFFQKIWLIPYETHCLHGVKFCRFLIWYLRVWYILVALYLLLALAVAFCLPLDMILAWASAGLFVLFDVPSLVIHFVLARPVFGRFSKYSFEKYHNTQDHSSIL